jgi:hypothetical protein
MPNKRKDNDPNNDTESVASVSSTTLRASKRSRQSTVGKAVTPLDTSNDLEDTNDSAETGSLQAAPVVNAATLPRAAKRSRSSTLNKSQMNSSNEIEENTTPTVAVGRTRTKTPATVVATATPAPLTTSSSIEANLHLYLEDLFDIFCSYQDETHRYLATIFYILPSAKVIFRNQIDQICYDTVVDI